MSDCMNRNCPNAAKIEELEAELKATQANEYQLAEANKRLLAENERLRAVYEAAKEYERLDNTNARLHMRKAIAAQEKDDD